MATLDEARAQALNLSTEERGMLSGELAASVFEPEALAFWLAEVDRRRERIESGEETLLGLDEFFRDDE